MATRGRAAAIPLLLVFVASLVGCDADGRARRRHGEACASDGQCQSGFCYLVCLLPEGDDDGDGLTNAAERQLQTGAFVADSDGDGVEDGADRCHGSPDDADADADTVPDGCDVCTSVVFGDDLADYDGDGLPCAQDPCLFDGPTPTAHPATMGPVGEVTIQGVDVAGTGLGYAVVEAGAVVPVTLAFEIGYCECPACLVQGRIGLAGQPPHQCFYSGVAGCTDSGMADLTLVAPAEPGTYFLRADRTFDFTCDTGAPLDPQREFAGLCVK